MSPEDCGHICLEFLHHAPGLTCIAHDVDPGCYLLGGYALLVPIVALD